MFDSSQIRQNSIKRPQFGTANKWITKEDSAEFIPDNCSENFHQYLLNSTLHGLRYVGEATITYFERGFFLLAFILVVGLSIYFISNVYEKWSATPVIITLAAIQTPITDIPFPAVTICNMNKARSSVVRKFEKNSIENVFLQNVCLKESNNTSSNRTDEAGRWDVFKNFLINVSQPCSEMLVVCRYALKEYKCLDLFDTVLTDEGLCCTFNSVHPMFLYKKYNMTEEFNNDSSTVSEVPVDWTPEEGFAAAEGVGHTHIYPRPGLSSGSEMGLFIVLNAAVEDYYCSSTNSAGFKIHLHNPTETPKVASYGLSIDPGQETGIIITPRMASSSKLIRKHPQVKRQCIFANEANLSYFRTYSKRNCAMECQSRIIESKCGCVIYYLPRMNADTRICSRKDAWCYESVRLAIERSENETYECRCLPGCYELSYYGDVLGCKLGTDGFSVHESYLHNLTPEFIRRNIAALHIFYMDGTFRSNNKEELIGFTDFLSNVGGLLGLFMGFSVLSIVEILYFLSFRPCCEHRKRMKFIRKKQTSINLIHAQRPQYENRKENIIVTGLKSTMNTKNIAKGFIDYAKSSLTLGKQNNTSNEMYPYFE